MSSTEESPSLGCMRPTVLGAVVSQWHFLYFRVLVPPPPVRSVRMQAAQHLPEFAPHPTKCYFRFFKRRTFGVHSHKALLYIQCVKYL